MVKVGCAGWSLSTAHAAIVNRADGSLLERYASTFNAVEINSSFYRHHQPKTYQRWAQVVPDDFRFAVKVPRTITHDARLKMAESQPILQRFLDECQELGNKLGPLLVQLPPKLAFDPSLCEMFLSDLRRRFNGSVVVEPRHRTWFSDEGEALLRRFHVGRVLADPAVTPEGLMAGGDTSKNIYLRLHGQPKIYYSAYAHDALIHYATLLQKAPQHADQWCIFDNTAAGHAVVNAWEMRELLKGRQLASMGF